MEALQSGNPAPLLVPLDVSDVYGDTIISSGEHITPLLMKDIGRSGRFSTTSCLALKDGRIRQDMEAALRTEPYAGSIPAERLEQIFRIYDDLAILPVLFDEFELSLSQRHTVIGYVLLTYYLGNAELDCCRAALLHHERRAGAGTHRAFGSKIS